MKNEQIERREREEKDSNDDYIMFSSPIRTKR